MSFVIPTAWKLYLNANNPVGTLTVGVALYRYAPVIDANDTRLQGVVHIADMASVTGFEEVNASTGYARFTGSCAPYVGSGGVTYMLMPTPNDAFVVPAMSPSQVEALVFYDHTTLTVIMITDDVFTDTSVIRGGDWITSWPDTSISTSVTPGSGNRWFIKWDTYPDATGAGAQFSEGPLQHRLTTPPYEVAHLEHVWMFPQRVNLVANPSFESPSGSGTKFWRSNGTMARTADTVQGYVCHTTGTAPIVMESNLAYYQSSEWSFQLLARGDGNIRVGLLFWTTTCDQVYVDWGPQDGTGAYTEVFALSGNFRLIRGFRMAPEARMVELRIETDGTTIDVDEVCLEPGIVSRDYFDGDSTYGIEGDFSWYEPSQEGLTYSLWYNDQASISDRLFHQPSPTEPGYGTSQAVQGLLYDWVPAGYQLQAHWGVLSVNDQITPPEDVGGTPVTTGVPSPW
jgi:hypothetical protein